ncbi:hypothetical protein ACES2L_01960 [Bdellovibrio bacteriovorus]
MKKKFMLAMAIVMLLGSVKALAEENDDIYNEIQNGKIEAAMAAQAEADAACLDCDETNVQGKWDAAELNMNLIAIESQIKQLEKMQDELSDERDTRGLLSAIGQTITIAEQKKKEINQSLDLSESRQLTNELAKEICNFNMINPLNQIRGLKVHEELGCK